MEETELPGAVEFDAPEAFDLNQFHEELLAAELVPGRVEQEGMRVRVFFADDEARDAAREAVEMVRASHVPHERPRSPSASDVIAALASIQLDGVTTVAGLKQAIEPIRDAAAALITAESQ